jgi:hypothetical protein
MKKLILGTVMGMLLAPHLGWADNLFRFNENAMVPVRAEYSELVVLNGSAEIKGRITGNVVVIRGDVFLESTAYIGGDVVCIGGQIEVVPGALVLGSKVEIGGQIGWKSLPFFSIGKVLLFSFLFKLVSAAGLILFCIFLVMMWPNQIRYTAEEVSADLLKSSLVGLFAIILLLPLAIGFAVTLFGIPISLAIFIFLLVARWFGIASVAYLLGHKMSARCSPTMAVLLGLLLLKVIHFVPFIGGAFYFIATLPGLGAILLTRFGTNKPWLSSGKNNPAKPPRVKA